jgi:formate--tetrahydrofolate ligase
MAIVAVASGHADLRRRLGAITVGYTREGVPLTAEQLGAAGAMAALLTDALKPNLVQTLEGRPALVHCGPFANIAHGNSSLIGDRLGLKLGDYVVTEGGFGADMGFEKFVDIACRLSGLMPSAVVLVATTQALKLHGGDPDGGLDALERGAVNLAAHIAIVREFGATAIVAVNRFPHDDESELAAVRGLALEAGAVAAEICDGFERGGRGAVDLAAAVAEAAERPEPVHCLYPLEASLHAKLDAIATRVYGAAAVELSPQAAAQAERLESLGLAGLPVCVAKTHLSLTHDPKLSGAPVGFTFPIRELRPYTGAGWIVAVSGAMQTMPGLPAEPAALRVDVDEQGQIHGLR